MPEKFNRYRTYGQKLISLYTRLLFSQEKHSLTDLSKFLDCSKQNVLKLVEDIEQAYLVTIEKSMAGNRRYFQIKRESLPPVNLTEHEIFTLQMCQVFTRHLMGKQQFENSINTLYKSLSLFSKNSSMALSHFGSITLGSIDYTPHQDSIRILIEAMNGKKVCKINYKRIGAEHSKVFYIKPLKLFSYKDTIYLHARMAKYPGKKYIEPDFDPLLAVHRILSVEKTETVFVFPDDYNFEKIFVKNFGVIKDEAFKVEIDLTGYAAQYVSERVWSADQKITPLKGGGIKIVFSTSSEAEIITWILSFGTEAKVIKPKWLKEGIKMIIRKMITNYEKQ